MICFCDMILSDYDAAMGSFVPTHQRFLELSKMSRLTRGSQLDPLSWHEKYRHLSYSNQNKVGVTGSVRQATRTVSCSTGRIAQS
jgi:hypothetical protein